MGTWSESTSRAIEVDDIVSLPLQGIFGISGAGCVSHEVQVCECVVGDRLTANSMRLTLTLQHSAAAPSMGCCTKDGMGRTFHQCQRPFDFAPPKRLDRCVAFTEDALCVSACLCPLVLGHSFQFTSAASQVSAPAGEWSSWGNFTALDSR